MRTSLLFFPETTRVDFYRRIDDTIEINIDTWKCSFSEVVMSRLHHSSSFYSCEVLTRAVTVALIVVSCAVDHDPKNIEVQAKSE